MFGFKVYSTALDNKIIKWDFNGGARLKTYALKHSLIAFVNIGRDFAGIQKSKSGKSTSS